MPNIEETIELKQINQPLTQKGGPQNTLTDPNQHNSCDQTMVHEQDHVNRPSVRGAYRPIRNGNIQGSIFAMLASALGTGCLNLPLRIQQLGIIPFFLIMLICAFLSYLGMYMMECIIVKYKVASYSEMVQKAYGKKIMRLSEVVLISYSLALSICCQVILAKFVVQILSDLFGMNLYEDRGSQIYNQSGNLVRVIVSILNLVLNFKHFFLTDLSYMLNSLGKFSVTGVVFCMALIVLTAFTGFTKWSKGEQIVYKSIFTMDYSHVEVFKQFSDNYFISLLQGISGVFFAFLNHQFIFPVISHLKRPTRRRAQRIFITAHVEEIIIYTIIGLLGYLLLSQHVDLIPISPLVITSIPTFPLMIGKIMLIGALFFTLPLQVFTAREYIYQALDIDRNQQNLKKLNTWIIGGTFVIGILFQKVNMYFGFIGGTTGTLMATIIPLFCMYKLITLTDYDKGVAIFAVIMSVILFIGAIQSLFSAV